MPAGPQSQGYFISCVGIIPIQPGIGDRAIALVLLGGETRREFAVQRATPDDAQAVTIIVLEACCQPQFGLFRRSGGHIDQACQGIGAQ